MTNAFYRPILILVIALVPGLAAGAPPTHKDALAEYVSAGKSLIAVLDGVKTVDTAKAAQINLLAAVARYNGARTNLHKLKFDQTNTEHQNLVKASLQDMTTVSAQLNQEMKRIRTLPQVQKLLSGTLAQLT